jgi:hypothetical protein
MCSMCVRDVQFRLNHEPAVFRPLLTVVDVATTELKLDKVRILRGILSFCTVDLKITRYIALNISERTISPVVYTVSRDTHTGNR